MTTLHKKPEQLWKLLDGYKRRHFYKGTVATASYQLHGGEHFTNPNFVGSKDHRIPENMRHVYRTEPGKNVDGEQLDMWDLQINLRDKAQNAVRDGVIDVLNAFYSLNVQQLATHPGKKLGVSSALIKTLSELAGVFQRDAFSTKDKRWKYKGSHDNPLQVSFNRDPGNWMWKAIVELLRVISLQMDTKSASGSDVLAVPADMNAEKVGDLVEAMIGEFMIMYPDGKYERTYPYRAVWVLPTMTTATPTDKAVLRFLELVAAAEDMAAVRAPKDETPHAWASAVLPPSDFLRKLVENRPPLGEGEKARSAAKAFKKQKRQAEMQARKKSKTSHGSAT